MKISVGELDATEKGIGSDMSLYFNKAIVLVSTKPGEAPKWRTYIGMDGEQNHCFSLNRNEVDRIPGGAKCKAVIETYFPTGYFNHGNTALYCERIPKRQYIKGICKSNFLIADLQAVASYSGLMEVSEAAPELAYAVGQMGHSGQAGVDWTPKFFEKVFSSDNAPTNIHKAYDLIIGGKVFARALGSKFAMCPSPDERGGCVVFYNELPAARFAGDRIRMLLPEFKQEFFDFFFPQGVKVVA